MPKHPRLWLVRAGRNAAFVDDFRTNSVVATVPLTLVTLPKLRELLLQHYERLDPATRALVPLQRLYWPVD